MKNNILPFPSWSTNDLSVLDGTFFEAPQICHKAKTRLCKRHYESIELAQGFHECPMGLSSYSSGEKGQPIVTAVRIADTYDRRKLRQAEGFLPTLPKKVVLDSLFRTRSLISEAHPKSQIKRPLDSNGAADTDATEDKVLVDFSLHEIRKFNTQIKRYAEELMISSANPDAKFVAFVDLKSKSIFASSSMLSTRLSVYDFEANPEVITSSSQRASLYKKFDKARRVLEVYAKDQRVRIDQFDGASYYEMDSYQVLDFLPFVILENAIKYSPKDQNISVAFDDTSTSLKVTVSSLGPKNTKEDLREVFVKRGRGSVARSLDTSGGGYGLYFAKLICELHDIDISVNSGDAVLTFNGLEYSIFTVELRLQK